MILTRIKDQDRVRVLLGSLCGKSFRNEDKREDAPEGGALNNTFAVFDSAARAAGLNLAQRRGLIVFVSASGILSALLAALNFNLLFLLIFPAVCWGCLWELRRRTQKRAENFERDYTALLLSLASAVRTGLDPLAALTQAGEFFRTKCEVVDQLDTLKRNIDGGMGEDEALVNFAGDINHPDIALFRTAFILARREGSGLAGCLQRLARVTRARQSFRRKVRSAVAMQRLSAFGIVLCTLVIGGIQWVTNPEALKLAWHDPFGFKLLGLGVGLVLCGLVWMLMLTRSRL